MELLRRGYQVTVGKSGEREVDFIGARQKEKLYIQVSYLLASDDTISRKFGVYDLIRDNYPKYVVSIDEFDKFVENWNALGGADMTAEVNEWYQSVKN